MPLGVRRLIAASEAPGLLDVYEADGRTEHVPGNDDDALVFVLVDQEPADGVAPELQHAPAHHDPDRNAPGQHAPDNPAPAHDAPAHPAADVNDLTGERG